MSAPATLAAPGLRLAARQVHLDFHNSPLIPDIAADFDPETFAETMEAAHVQSVTVFSKCHHGLSYHPTQIGTQHPSLRRDLLGEMIEALHRRGLRAVAYLSVCFDELMAEREPGWRQVGADGSLVGRSPLQATAGWAHLCLGSPYLDHIAAQAEEVVRRYPVDGVFYDIVVHRDPTCWCGHCQRRLGAEGVDLQDPAALRASSLRLVHGAMERLSAIVRAHRPDGTIFFNSRTRTAEQPEQGSRPELAYQTHVEIESLPTGGWGYLHLPTFARYFQTLGVQMLGMTARFHGTWSDFGSLKTPAALSYELSLMQALGAGCSVGDQLHPRGVPDRATYELIGDAFADVAEREEWCIDAEPVVEVGVVVVDDRDLAGGHVRWWNTIGAAQRALAEEQFLFQLVDRDADWSRYRAVVLPDHVRLDAAFEERLARYVEGGGRVLATYLSGLSEDGRRLALPGLDADVDGALPRRREEPYLEVEYLGLEAPLSEGLPPEEFVVYGAGVHVRAPDGAGTGRIGLPYFQRSGVAYSGHRQAPFDRWSAFPAAVQTGSVLWFAHELFGQYGRYAVPAHRRLLGNGLRRLLGDTLVTTGLPAGGVVTMTRQPGRHVLHLLYAIPEHRGQFEVIEDLVELRDVRVSVRLPGRPARAYVAPSREPVPLDYAPDGRATLVVPRVRGHQMLVLEDS